MSSKIYVCQSGTCRSKGSDATLIEIEELAKLVNARCKVERTGCLGYCRQGPAVEIVKNRRHQYHVKVNTFRKSAAVIVHATGEEPPTENLPPETEARLAGIRAEKQWEYFVSTYQWNKAISGLLSNGSVDNRITAILECAGYSDLNPRDLLYDGTRPLAMPSTIRNYTKWRLSSSDIVSPHSAIYHFVSADLKRGTPHPRGRAQLPNPITWHVTMLGEIGRNEEGPLPWIERDYTPISSALDWEKGRCSILIKIYNDGMLTNWLHKMSHQNENGRDVNIFLSKPIKTLSVPSLTTDDDEDGFRPKSILLLLAGTGIVALPQIMAHREPHRLLGISIPKYKQMKCHIDLIHSCRKDDVLMLSEIKEYCLAGTRDHPRFQGLRNYTLLVTDEKKDGGKMNALPPPPPFQHVFDRDDIVSDYEVALKDIPNATVTHTRLDKEIIASAIGRLESPFRIIVSGPNTYNNAAREFLQEIGVQSKCVTVLTA
eukprot:scaffold382649_cov119-Cyclotella_meneghiniana.AAC.1